MGNEFTAVRNGRANGKGNEDQKLLQDIIARRRSRRESMELSRALLSRFGRIGNILRANDTEFSGIAGFGPDVASELASTHALLRALARREISGRPVLADSGAVANYCRIHLAGEAREQFHVLFLDRALQLIAHDCLQIGTVDHVTVYPREIVRRALAVSACALVLVHNHPSGNPRPSHGDVAMTRQIARAGAFFGIRVADHIIVGTGENYSFRMDGLLTLELAR